MHKINSAQLGANASPKHFTLCGLASALAAATLVFTVVAAHAQVDPNECPTDLGQGADTVTTQQVKVNGKHLMRAGQVWIPHGVVSITFVRSPAGNADDGHFTTEYENYVNESDVDKIAYFQSMLDWGADSVRMQVSQPASDPQDPNGHYDPQFVRCVKHAVNKARQVGLNVIISMQDETGTGEAEQVPLPNAATTRAWTNIAPPFINDRGVLLELYNEPSPPPGSGNWANWKTAMDNLTSQMRGIGATNVVIADGLNKATNLTTAPMLSDPQTAYAVHPYFWASQAQTPAGWATRFGNLSATVPVLITEWTTSANFNIDSTTPDLTQSLLSYIDGIGVGLEGFTFGSALPSFGSIVTGTKDDVNATMATTYLDTDGTTRLTCTPPPVGQNQFNCPDNYGPGKMVKDYYNTGIPPNVE